MNTMTWTRERWLRVREIKHQDLRNAIAARKANSNPQLISTRLHSKTTKAPKTPGFDEWAKECSLVTNKFLQENPDLNRDYDDDITDFYTKLVT